MIDKLLKVDSTKDNLVDQIQDLQERISELERFALTSQDIKANKIAVGLEAVLGDIVDGDLATIPWTDYSATSTIVGWSSYTVKKIFYKKIGALVFVQFIISGTSDDTNSTFTLPYTQQDDLTLYQVIAVQDDGGSFQSGQAKMSLDTAHLVTYKDVAGSAFTASGTKAITGNFWFESV